MSLLKTCNKFPKVCNDRHCFFFVWSAGTTKEHLGFALALKVPVIVVVTKIDQCKKVVVEKLISQLDKLLKSPGCSKIPVRVSDEDDAITAATNFASERCVFWLVHSLLKNAL